MDKKQIQSTVADPAVGSIRPFWGASGFSLIEVLIAIVILSVALLSLSSVSLQIIGGNKTSSNYVAASLIAQDSIEMLRSGNFNLGGDMAIGGGDDTVAPELVNCSAANDGVIDPAAIFSNPDYAYTVTEGVEDLASLLSCPTNLAPAKTLRRTWRVIDDSPASGMKSVTVVVGWTEKGAARYFDLTTALVGQ
jgi:prepilin-type N-terminal cleavage/methylation domain-containing protein